MAAWKLPDLLQGMLDLKASDLLLTVGTPPQYRVHGHLQAAGEGALTPEDTERFAAEVLGGGRRAELFEKRKSADLSHALGDRARFRVNVFRQKGFAALALRHISTVIPSYEDLGLPETLHEFSAQPFGLILITGPTGSGKSTTLAAMLDEVNRKRAAHIICVEDPIEYLHTHKGCTVEQIEIGEDSLSFKDAMRHLFRQTPDVIMVGEMRDPETIALALTLAETGHLVLATLHTQDTSNAINRIVDSFPADQQPQVLMQLSMTLVGICSQQLLRTRRADRRVLACEVMKATGAIRNLIREGSVQQLYSVVQTGRAEGMISMEESLRQLVALDLIDEATAINRSFRPKEMVRLLRSKYP